MAGQQTIQFNLDEVTTKIQSLEAQLQALDAKRGEIQAEINNLRSMQKQAAKAEIEAKMKELGITIEDLGGVKRMKVEVPKANTEPKYRNPANPAETWSGRGKPPKWAREAQEAGTLEDCRIKP